MSHPMLMRRCVFAIAALHFLQVTIDGNLVA
jgi:hypothetical protein